MRSTSKRSPAEVAAGDQSLSYRYLARRLGGFSPYGGGALARVGFCFLCEREILAAGLIQEFLSFPTVVKRDSCSYQEHHHDNRNDHLCRLAGGGRCGRRSGYSRRNRRIGSFGRRADRRGGYSRVRYRFADRLGGRRLGNGRRCRFPRLC